MSRRDLQMLKSSGKSGSAGWACSLVSVTPYYRPAMPFGNRKKIEDLFSLVLSHFKKYHPFGNLKFNDLGIFQSLKLRNLMEKSFQYLLS